MERVPIRMRKATIDWRVLVGTRAGMYLSVAGIGRYRSGYVSIDDRLFPIGIASDGYVPIDDRPCPIGIAADDPSRPP